MLDIKNLKVSFNGHNVLRGIDLSIKRGEPLALIGESGAGKTTFGLSVLGLVEGQCFGKIMLQEINLLALSEQELRHIRGRRIAMVFQNIDNALHPLYPIINQVVEAIIVHGQKDKNMAYERAYRLLEMVGLNKQKAKFYPHQLSGGEKQRLLLCIALANDPDVLILDEPTAALDAVTKAEIIDLIKRISKDKVSLIITHDISSAARLAEKTAVLYGGIIIEMGKTKELLSSPKHSYTRGLLRSYPNMTTNKDLQGIPGKMILNTSGCPFYSRCTQSIEVCGREIPELHDKEGRLIACHRGGIISLLELKNIRKCFGNVQILNNVNLTLYEGETLALIGESGSGKTTLANVIMGLYKDYQGKILLKGRKKRAFLFFG